MAFLSVRWYLECCCSHMTNEVTGGNVRMSDCFALILLSGKLASISRPLFQHDFFSLVPPDSVSIIKEKWAQM